MTTTAAVAFFFVAATAAAAAVDGDDDDEAAAALRAAIAVAVDEGGVVDVVFVFDEGVTWRSALGERVDVLPPGGAGGSGATGERLECAACDACDVCDGGSGGCDGDGPPGTCKTRPFSADFSTGGDACDASPRAETAGVGWWGRL